MSDVSRAAPATAYIALGANLGPRLQTLVQAVDQLTTQHPVELIACSPLYESSAVGGPPDQPNYLNAVIAVHTILTPHDLLGALHDIEQAFGRQRRHRNAPRTLDLDLLLYDEQIIDDARLQVPHPRMHQRRFVLQPLADLDPALHHPGLRQPISSLLQRLETTGQQLVRRADQAWLKPCHTSH